MSKKLTLPNIQKKEAAMATCNQCHWVFFEITREQAEKDVKSFDGYFFSLSPKEREENYGGKSSHIEDYEHCYRCGNSYKNFRPSIESDCSEGCTLNPIIRKED